ncbi:MAG TPA: ABC transporter permease [Bryobacteraceae bacterium]
MRQDLQYAIRNIVRNPGFTVAAVLSIALGIGLNSMLFTFFNAIFFRPLDVKEPARVTKLFTRFADSTDSSLSSYPAFEDYRAHNSVYDGLAAHAGFTVNLCPSIAGNAARRAYLYAVSSNFFPVLGLQPSLGRGFRPDDGRAPVAILSENFWRVEFGADPEIIGRTIKLNDSVFTVIGVGPRAFLSLDLADQVDVYVPLTNVLSVQADQKLLTCRDCAWLNMIGRLKPGYSPQAAEAGMQTLAAAIASEHPELARRPSVRIAPATLLAPDEARKILPVLTLIFTAVGAILMIACGNVTSLLLARASGRRKEIAMRVALGAGRLRLIRQLLTESLVLAAIGGAVSLFLVMWLQQIIPLLQPPGERMLAWHLTPDVRVLVFTVALALITGVLFGLTPALQSSRPDLIVSLREKTGSASGSGRSRFRQTLVAGQVALSLVLLIAAGLLVRGIRRAQQINPGFQTAGVLAASIELEKFGYDRARAAIVFRQITGRLRSAALASTSPVAGRVQSVDVLLDGEGIAPPRKPRMIGVRVITPGYFETLGMALIGGRAFSEADSALAPKVAIVNQTMAKTFWAVGGPLGKQFRAAGTAYTVIGVAPDAMSRLSEAPRPQFYAPLEQWPQLNMTLLAAAAVPAESLLSTIRRELSSIDAKLQIYSAQTLDEQLRASLRNSEIGAILAAAFGILALILASIGLYGVMAFTVSHRTQEIGIRMALGATAGEVLSMVVRQGLTVSLAGAGVGVVIALGVSRLLTEFLYGVSASDPLTYVVVSIMLAGVAILSSYIPARRAARVDPITALRYE